MPAPLLSRPVLRLGTTTLLSLMPVLVAGCDRLGGTTDVNARVREVRVDPATEMILAGGTRTFSAVALDAAGGQIASARFTWATSDTSVAVVDTAGAVAARGAGTATITARVGRSAGSATVTVVAGVRLGFVQPTRDGGRRFSREGPYHLELLPGDSLVLLLMMQGGGGFPFSPPLHGAVWASSDTAIVQARPLPTPGDSGVVLRSLMPGKPPSAPGTRASPARWSRA